MLCQRNKGYFIPFGKMNSCNHSHWKEDKAQWRLFPAAASPKATFSWFQMMPLLLQEEGRWKCEKWLCTCPHYNQFIWYQTPGLHLVQWGGISVCLGRCTHFLLLSSVTHSSPDFFSWRKLQLRANWCYSHAIYIQSLLVWKKCLICFQCFKVFASNITRNLTWHAARDVCFKLGGNLASIPNEQVQGMYMGSMERKNLNISLKKLLYSPV